MSDPLSVVAASDAVDEPTPTSDIDLRAVDRSLVRGVAWNGIFKIVGQVASWVSSLYVARILSPDDYGVFGLGLLLLGFVQSLVEFGVGVAVVAEKELESHDFAQLNSVSVLFGLAGSIVTIALAPLASLFFHSKNLTPVVMALGLTLFIGSFRTLPWAVLQRQLHFRNVAIYDAMQAVFVAGFSITLALLGFRYWTLVFAAVAASIISTTVTVLRHPIPFARPDVRRLRGTLELGWLVVIERMGWYVYSNADFAVAGRVLGKAMAGVYGLAWSLGRTVVDKVGVLVLQITPAIFAKVQRDIALIQRYFIHLTSALSLVFWPMTVGFALVTPEFVHAILSSKWEDAIWPLTLLSGHSALTLIASMCGQVMLVRGDQRYSVRLTMAQVLVMPLTFYVGAEWGVTGIAAGWAIVHPIFLAMRMLRTLKLIDLSPKRYFVEGLMPATIGCLVMFIAVVAARRLSVNLPVVPRLAVLVLVGAASYSGTLYIAFRERMRDAIAQVRALRSAA